MKWLAKIEVTLKKSVLDPQGAAVEKALNALNYHNVEEVRVGKYLELYLTCAREEEAREQVKDMCNKLLTNPVIEDYEFYLSEVR